MNRKIDSVSTEEVSSDRRVEYADNSRISRLRKTFRRATENVMQGDFDHLREDLANLRDEILDFFRSEPTEEKVEDKLVDVEVRAFYSKEGLGEANKKLSYLTNRNKELEDRVQRALEEEEAAKKCGLTGLLLKKFFLRNMFGRLGMMKREVHESAIPVSAVFFDIDRFKKVNDTYGHDLGDEAISKIGECINRKFQREGDVKGKFGGDEFVMLLPNCDMENAKILLEELRQDVEAIEFTAFENGNSEKFNITISTGIFTANLFNLNGKYNIKHLVKVLIKGADEQLYKSKHNGRNRVTAVSADMPEIEKLLKKAEKEGKKETAIL